MRSPNAAISGPPDSLIPISQSARRNTHQYESLADKKKIRTAVDDGNSHQNTRPASKRTHEIRRDREQAENGTTKRSRSGDDALELLVHAAFTVTSHNL
jgi:hypothetical protein